MSRYLLGGIMKGALGRKRWWGCVKASSAIEKKKKQQLQMKLGKSGNLHYGGYLIV